MTDTFPITIYHNPDCGTSRNVLAMINAMLEHPMLVHRPIVITPKGTRLCRPAEVVLSLLDR